MQKQNMILLRNFLFKTFIVGLLFALFIFVMTMTFWDNWTSLVFSKFQLPAKELAELFVNSMLTLRLYLIFVILVPAIALHWTIKSLKN